MHPELIVNFNKKNIQQVVMIIPIVLLLCVFLHALEESVFSFLPLVLIKFVMIFFIFLLAVGSVYYFVITRNNKPAAVLNKEGIWIIRHGFMPWEAISDVFMHRMSGAPLEIVAINLKDPESIARQSSFGGKCVLFWSKLFGYPHIFLTNIDIEDELVISFSKKYIASKNRI